VGQELGVGLTGIFAWSTNEDSGAPTITTFSFGGGVSISYN
jgi:hypothetical protein